MYKEERGTTHLRYQDKLLSIDEFTMRMITYSPKKIHLMRLQYPDYRCNNERLLERVDLDSACKR